MDAADTMNEAEKLALRDWASSDSRAGMHIDDLFPGLERWRWLSVTLLALEELALCVPAASRPALLVACFPLECTPTLDTHPPEWAEVVSSGSDEPPSLHIVNCEAALLPEANEEYRYPLEVPSLSNRNVYYRCFRPRIGIDNEWEYSRAVYVEVRILP